MDSNLGVDEKRALALTLLNQGTVLALTHRVLNQGFTLSTAWPKLGTTKSTIID